MSYPHRLTFSLVAAVLCAAPMHADAVILYRTADRNGAPDPASIAYPGWQLQGDWSPGIPVSGTPIASQYFLTAQHVGGSAATPFVFQGTTYSIDAAFGAGGFVNVPGSDLRIWKVAGTFPTWAELYTKSDEVGKHLVVYGRGRLRNGDVIVDSALRGWQWGASDGVRSWGENDVFSIAVSTLGPMLAFTFDAGGGPNEATIAEYDSGGAVFIQDGGVWKLAGINSAADGRYSRSSDGSSPFYAALFDKAGLYEETSPNVWQQTTPGEPGAAFASRISPHAAFIQNIIPEPGSAVLVLCAAAFAALIRRR